MLYDGIIVLVIKLRWNTMVQFAHLEHDVLERQAAGAGPERTDNLINQFFCSSDPRAPLTQSVIQRISSSVRRKRTSGSASGLGSGSP